MSVRHVVVFTAASDSFLAEVLVVLRLTDEFCPMLWMGRRDWQRSTRSVSLAIRGTPCSRQATGLTRFLRVFQLVVCEAVCACGTLMEL